jgi:hypothetical protein
VFEIIIPKRRKSWKRFRGNERYFL